MDPLAYEMREEKAEERCIAEIFQKLDLNEFSKPQLSKVTNKIKGEEGQFDLTLVTNDGFVGLMRVHGHASTGSFEGHTALSSQTKSIVPLPDSMFASPA